MSEFLAWVIIVFFVIYAMVKLSRRGRANSATGIDDSSRKLSDIETALSRIPTDLKLIMARLQRIEERLDGRVLATHGEPLPDVTAKPQPKPEAVTATVAPREAPLVVKPAATAVTVRPSAATPPPAPRVVASPPAHKPRSQVAEDVDTVLVKMWNWVLMGRETPPTDVSRETAIARWWLMVVGVLSILCGGGYFLILSIERGWLAPAGRVALAIAGGLGLLIWGLAWYGRRYHILAQGFLGGGLALLYFAMYAAGPMFHEIPVPAAFALDVLITLAAGVLAVRMNSQLTAILGIIGGFATPVMLHTDTPNLPVLYTYLLVLSAGVLGIAHVKQWRMLNYLAFLSTWVLFFGSLGAYHKEESFALAMTFLTLLFVLHSSIVYYYNVLKRTATGVLEVIHLVANVALYGATSYALIADAHGRPWPAAMALAVAAFYTLHVFTFLRMNLRDRNLLICLIGIAGFFTIWAVPLIFEKDTLSIFWALQAAFFLWLGLKLGSSALVGISSILYCIVMARMTFWDLPRNFGELNWADRPFVEYLKGLAERLWTFGIVIGSLFAAYRLHGAKLKQLARFSVAEGADVRMLGRWPRLRGAAFWCGVALLFSVVYLELTQMFSYYTPMQAPVLTALWGGLAAYLVLRFKRSAGGVFLGVASAVVFVAVGKLLFYDLDVWGLSGEHLVYRNTSIHILMRFFDFGSVALVLWFFYTMLRGEGRPRYDRAFKIATLALVFLHCTLEINTLCYWHLPSFRAGAVSIVWGLFAIAFLVRGLWSANKAYRYTGLVLFGVVVFKVFLVDLADMAMAYKVVAALIVGVLLIGGSGAYIKANRAISAKDGA